MNVNDEVNDNAVQGGERFSASPHGSRIRHRVDDNKIVSLVGEPAPYRRTYDRDDGSVVDW